MVLQIASSVKSGAICIVDESEDTVSRINQGKMMFYESPYVIFSCQSINFRKMFGEAIAKKLWPEKVMHQKLLLLDGQCRVALQCGMKDFLTKKYNQIECFSKLEQKDELFDYVIAIYSLLDELIDQEYKRMRIIGEVLEQDPGKDFYQLIKSKVKYIKNLMSLLKPGGSLILDAITFYFLKAGVSGDNCEDECFENFLKERSCNIAFPIITLEPIAAQQVEKTPDGGNPFGEIVEMKELDGTVFYTYSLKIIKKCE